jgi:RNA polymerase sigma-70 factor, ECF subfamily
MHASEIQPAVNAIVSLPPAAGNDTVSDEHSLVAKAKSGHEDSFGELYKRHQHRAYRTAVRILRNEHDAEDAVQRAFQRALVNLQRFREDSTFSTWLTRIVINEAIMAVRARRTREAHYENTLDDTQGDRCMEIPCDGPTPEEIFRENERRAALNQAIGQLRKNLRIVVQHRELKGLTSVETARELGLTDTAVKARMLHARRCLKKHLERSWRRPGTLSKLRKARTQTRTQATA